MDPATIGAIISGGGKLLDAWFGSKQRKNAPKLAGQTAFLENQQGLLGRLDAAKAAGIHPVLALGGSITGSGAPMSVGTDFSSLGSDYVQSALQKRELQMRKEELAFQQDQAAKQSAAAVTQRQLELEDQALRNELTRVQIEAQRKEMSDSDRNFAAAQQQLALRQSMHTPLTSASQIPNQYTQVRDRFGKIQLIPNPAIYDNELPETVGAFGLLAPEFGYKLGEHIERMKKKWRSDKQAVKQFYYEKIKGYPHNVENDSN